MRHLTSLFLNGNLLTRIPPEIAQLNNLTMLDLSHNKLRSLPAELGDMVGAIILGTVLLVFLDLPVPPVPELQPNTRSSVRTRKALPPADTR